MKNIKKIAALILALAMVFALTATAFAADDTYTGSENANAVEGQGRVDGNNIPLTKSIVLFNTDGSEIREPNISYTYTVTPVVATAANQGKLLTGVTVTDDGSRNSGTPVTVNVYDGVDAAFTSTLTLSFADSNSKVAAAQDGTELEKTGNLVVDPAAFPHAGIYRFVITETVSPSDVTTVGLDTRDAAYSNVRFLDVYIKNIASAPGLAMYGAVIFKSTTTDAIDSNNGDIVTTTEKTTGFEPDVDGTTVTNYEDDPTVDKYHTFNLEVNKTITGGLADKTHDFPFEITLTGDKAATITADYSKTGASYVGTEPSTVAINTTASVLTPALSDGDSVKITGIPVGTTVLVKETNDTVDKYTPSITTQTGFTGLTLTETAALDPSASTQLNAAASITDKAANSVIGLTNNLAEVSPTGYVVRIAPYAIMLGLGIALLMITRRRKDNEEEAVAA